MKPVKPVGRSPYVPGKLARELETAFRAKKTFRIGNRRKMAKDAERSGTVEKEQQIMPPGDGCVVCRANAGMCSSHRYVAAASSEPYSQW